MRLFFCRSRKGHNSCHCIERDRCQRSVRLIDDNAHPRDTEVDWVDDAELVDRVEVDARVIETGAKDEVVGAAKRGWVQVPCNAPPRPCELSEL